MERAHLYCTPNCRCLLSPASFTPLSTMARTKQEDKDRASRSPSRPAAKAAADPAADEPMVPLKMVVLGVALAFGAYYNVPGVKPSLLKAKCERDCRFTNRCDCNNDGIPDCVPLGTCEAEFKQCKAFYAMTYGWTGQSAAVEHCTFEGPEDFDHDGGNRHQDGGSVPVKPQVDMACIEETIRKGEPSGKAFQLCACGTADTTCAASELGFHGEFSQKELEKAGEAILVDVHPSGKKTDPESGVALPGDGIPDILQCMPPLFEPSFLQQLAFWHGQNFGTDVEPFKPAPEACGECMCLAVCDTDNDGICDALDDDDDGDGIPDEDDHSPGTCDNNGDGVCNAADKKNPPAAIGEAPAPTVADLGDLAPDGFVDTPGLDSDGDGIPDSVDPDPFVGCPAGKTGTCLPHDGTGGGPYCFCK